MTEDEILAALKKADDLLAEYKKVVEPAAAALAELKSQHMGDCTYTGDLGCYESGIDAICLHAEQGSPIRPIEGYMRIRAFEAPWREKMEEAGIYRIYLGGMG